MATADSCGTVLLYGMGDLEIMWKCLACGHMWPDQGQPLPQICTNCGAPKTEFELVTED